MKKPKINIIGTYKLKHTLYPTYDNYYSYDKDDWYECSGDRILRKGTIFNVVLKKDFCKMQNYDKEEIEGFMDYSHGCDYVAYMRRNQSRYMVTNSLEDFEVINDELLIFK